MTTHTDILIGRIALERGLITREQLADCLKEQTAQPAHAMPALGTILVRRGFIAQPDLDYLLEEQKRRLAQAVGLSDSKLEDAILGRLLVRSGLATEKQVYECLRMQAELSEQGHPAPRLGDLLVRQGYLSTDAVADALQLQPTLHFVCPQCGGRFSLFAAPNEKPHACKKCGTPLVRTDPPDDQSLKISHAPLPDEVAAAAAQPNRRLANGRYTLVKVVGRGGMGVVWKAWQNDLERYAAIKQMSEGLWGETELKRFFREAQTAANLSHANIATIYEVGTHEGKHYIAMEFVDGDPLSAYSFGTPHTGRHSAGRPARHLSLNHAVQIVRDSALAVDYAHSKGVIHRDIKPHNIMIARGGGRVYVMDFGLAKPVKTRDGISMGDTIMGTPPYMSPEQARGEAVDRRTDVYALGAVLYTVLTGRAPFAGNSPAETLMKVLSDDPVPPRQIHPSIPVDLELIALKCLEKDKHRRYDSAKALADDLTRHLEGEPIRARPMSVVQRAVRVVRHRPLLMSSLAIGGAALLLVVFAFRMALHRDDTETNIYLKQGSQLHQKGQSLEALIAYEKALALDPQNEEALAGRRRCEDTLNANGAQLREWRSLADECFERGDYALALTLYQRLPSLASDMKLKQRIGECQRALERQKAAATDLDREVREMREQAEKARQHQEKRARAMPLYASAQQLLETAQRLALLPGRNNDSKGQEDEAIQLLGQCLAQDASYVEAYHLRGYARRRAGDLVGAAEDFAAALRGEPTFAPAAFGALLTHLIRYALLTYAPYLPARAETVAALEEVGRLAERAGQLSTDPYERWASKAVGHLRTRNVALAFEAMAVINTEGRTQRSYYFILAMLHLERQDTRAAIRELSALLATEPTAWEALFLRAILSTRSHPPQLASARQDADQLVALLARNPSAYLARALVLERSDDLPAAARDLEKAIQLDDSLTPLLKRDLERLKHP